MAKVMVSEMVAKLKSHKYGSIIFNKFKDGSAKVFRKTTIEGAYEGGVLSATVNENKFATVVTTFGAVATFMCIHQYYLGWGTEVVHREMLEDKLKEFYNVMVSVQQLEGVIAKKNGELEGMKAKLEICYGFKLLLDSAQMKAREASKCSSK